MDTATTTKRKPPETADEKLLHAFRHPLRIELLRHFNEGVTSPRELATRLRQPLGTVSYHVRELEKAGAIELVKEEPKRGAVEHLYRSLVRPTVDGAEWAGLEDEERAAISSQILQNTFSEAFAALESGTLDARLDRHLAWQSVSLDEEGWAKLMNTLWTTFFETVPDIEAESLARRKTLEDLPEIKAIVSFMGFERSPLAPTSRRD